MAEMHKNLNMMEIIMVNKYTDYRVYLHCFLMAGKKEIEEDK
jgi:hypothetical protein